MSEKVLRDLSGISREFNAHGRQLPLFSRPEIQTILQRLLYVWAMRHPASGYVQGINDLVRVECTR